MSVRVILEIVPGAITQESWSSVYDETLRVLRAHPTGLMGCDIRTLEETETVVFTRALECDAEIPGRRRWSVAGDRATLRAGETQWFFHSIEHYRNLAPERDQADADDILLQVARSRDGAPPLVEVFGGNTRGAPHHVPLLAAAMVVEDRLPESAMVRGDIDPGQCLRAQELVRDALGRDVKLPVRVDAVALHERLRARYAGLARARLVHRLMLDENVRREEAVLRVFPWDEAEAWWLDAIRAHRPFTLGASWLIVAWLNARDDLAGLCLACCHDPRGPSFPPGAFAELLAELWVGVPVAETRALDLFRKPAGDAPSELSALGSWVLDLGGPGRRLDRRYSNRDVREAFRVAFGVAADVLYDIFEDRTAQIRAVLGGVRERVERFADQAARDAQNAPEELFTVRSLDALTETQRGALRALASMLCTVRRDLEALDPKNAGWLYGDATSTRRRLTRMIARRGPPLTEEAWERIAATDDLATLHALMTLATLSKGETNFAHVQRAIYENELLRDHLVALVAAITPPPRQPPSNGAT
jgi:hypothetical protein